LLVEVLAVFDVFVDGLSDVVLLLLFLQFVLVLTL